MIRRDITDFTSAISYFPNYYQEGKALKLLATAARLDIEDFLQKKVFLEVIWLIDLSMLSKLKKFSYK